MPSENILSGVSRPAREDHPAELSRLSIAPGGEMTDLRTVLSKTAASAPTSGRVLDGETIHAHGDRRGSSPSERGRPVVPGKEQLAPGVPQKYRRATYIHPLFDPRGNVISDDFPKDHVHHRGLSWTWAHVGVGGEVHDLWAGEGVRQVFEKWIAKETGPVCATIGVKNAWWTAQRKIMDEW
jgi:hypothetical protein